MSTTRKLSLAQIVIMGIQLILSIVLIATTGFGLFSFGAVGIIMLILWIAAFIMGIVQIVFGAKEHSGLGITNGILAILIFIPFVSIAALVTNIITLAKK